MTYARVDKANQEITLLAKKIEESDVGQLTEEVANLKVTTDSIAANVQRVETNTNEAIADLSNEVSASVTADEVSFLISSELGSGATSITTTTGYEFNEAGLTIARTGQEMYTQVTENGMKVIRTSDNSALLTCNAQGVVAKNLTATTYLNTAGSRFERYNAPSRLGAGYGTRTGCFWMGG